MEKQYFGVMLDMSRNAVMKPAMLKKYVDYLSAFGYNMLQLYTEDTYQVCDEPIFPLFFNTKQTVCHQHRKDDKHGKTGNRKTGINTTSHQDGEWQKLSCLHIFLKRPSAKSADMCGLSLLKQWEFPKR